VPTWFLDRDDYALEAAKRYPDRFGVVLRPTLRNPASGDRMRELAQQDGVLGIRAVFVDRAFSDLSASSWLTDGGSDWLFELAAELDLPVMLYAPGQNEAVGRLAARLPELKLMLDHMNCLGEMAPGGMDDIPRELDTLLPLAAHPNVGVKVKAWLPQLRADSYPYPSTWPQLERVISAFGADRCFWMGDFTDFPGLTYEQLIGMFLEMPSLSERDKELVMGEAISTWLGWD
jgi:predicted TIM-barrel fold metal-dependent hydrolase